MYTHSGNHAEKQEVRNQCIDPETRDVQVEIYCFQNTKLGDMTIVADKQELYTRFIKRGSWIALFRAKNLWA